MNFLESCLIVDAGGTKTTWCETGGDSEPLRVIKTGGINVSAMSADAVRAVIENELLPQLGDGSRITAVHYYGAGVVSDADRRLLADVLGRLSDRVDVNGDMLGAARAVLGTQPGIACILGTGSNTCLYDGHLIVDNVPGMGYILGDEGSGASIGRRFVGDLFKREYPDEVRRVWDAETGLDFAAVVDRVYRRQGANSFLGSVVPLVRRLTSVPAVGAMVADEFDRFFRRNVIKYDGRVRRVGLVGSVALHFAPEITAAAEACGYEIAAIMSDPMPGLIKYHADC
ncbi:MAG: ATPase [Muribaculaceae bacterium]|nr:ATPase [Muribaculaceae bacterium]